MLESGQHKHAIQGSEVTVVGGDRFSLAYIVQKESPYSKPQYLREPNDTGMCDLIGLGTGRISSICSLLIFLQTLMTSTRSKVYLTQLSSNFESTFFPIQYL